MPPPGFRRSLPLLDLSPAESTQIRIKPKRELTNYEVALGAAKAGALGGPVAGNLGRSMISYEDWLSDIKSRPVIFRGLRGDDIDPRAPLASSRFGAAYGSTNPATAATYATPSVADLDRYGGSDQRPKNLTLRQATDPSGKGRTFGDIAEGGSVYPVRASRSDVLRYTGEDLDRMGYTLGADRMGRYEALSDIVRNRAASMTEREAAARAIGNLEIESDFNTLSTKTPMGRAISLSGLSTDTWAEYPPLDPSHLSALPEDTYSWRDPSAVDLAGKPFRANETSGLLRAAAKRLGYPEEGLSNEVFAEAARETPYSKPIRGPVDPWTAPELLPPQGSEYTDKARKLIDEVQNDPRFKPTMGARAAKFLKSMAREAVRPKNILLDALIGSGAGVGSALAGYAAGQPRSAGVFDLPGEYQQALTNEDLMAQIESRTATKEALRQKYVDQVNDRHGPGTLQPGARIEEIRDYLGPVRGLQGR